MVDVAARKVTSEVAVGKDPYGAALTPDGRFVYSGNLKDNSLSVIDTDTLKVVATVTGLNEPRQAIAFSSDNAHAYVLKPRPQRGRGRPREERGGFDDEAVKRRARRVPFGARRVLDLDTSRTQDKDPMLGLFQRKDRLIVHGKTPYNAEPPLDRLRAAFLTDQADFYVRSHGDIPDLDADGYRLTVDGMVATPSTSPSPISKNASRPSP